MVSHPAVPRATRESIQPALPENLIRISSVMGSNPQVHEEICGAGIDANGPIGRRVAIASRARRRKDGHRGSARDDHVVAPPGLATDNRPGAHRFDRCRWMIDKFVESLVGGWCRQQALHRVRKQRRHEGNVRFSVGYPSVLCFRGEQPQPIRLATHGSAVHTAAAPGRSPTDVAFRLAPALNRSSPEAGPVPINAAMCEKSSTAFQRATPGLAPHWA
jgi:hypothetical protein